MNRTKINKCEVIFKLHINIRQAKEYAYCLAFNNSNSPCKNSSMSTFNLSKTLHICIRILLIINIMGLRSIAQIPGSIDYYIENKATKGVFDVKGGSILENTTIGQYKLNFTKAQTFKIVLFGNSENNTYYIKPLGSLLYLTCKKSLVTAQPNTDQKQDYYGLIQNKKIEYDRRSEVSPLYPSPKQQQWKLVPVPNESDTYFIQSVFFTENMVIEPSNNLDISSLRVTKWTGAENQKWRILPTLPNAPSGLQLANFKWQFGGLGASKILGKLSWTDNANNETGFRVYLKRLEPDGQYARPFLLAELGKNATTYDINQESGRGENRQHCFYVVPFNNWGGGHKSTENCEIARSQVESINVAAIDIICKSGCYPVSPTGCTGYIDFRLTPIQLTGSSGTTSSIVQRLGNGYLQSTPSLHCCMYKYTGGNLATGRWKMEAYLRGAWYNLGNIDLASGANIIRFCSDLPHLGAIRDAYRFPCDN